MVQASWWAVAAGNQDGVFIEVSWRSALCKVRPGCGQLQQELDGQGASMEAGGLSCMVNIMWTASAESQSVRGA